MALSSNELAQMRDDVELLLPDTCTILTATFTTDAYGGFIETWGTTYSGVKCRMDHKTGREQLSGGAVETYQGNMLTVPYATTITTANRVIYGGSTYNIMSVSEGSWLACKRVVVERV